MALSKRAQSYLAGLKRQRPTDTAKVSQFLLSAGFRAPDCWLAFHDAYGGYVQAVGVEMAVLGLVHAEPAWLTPMELMVEGDESGRIIACADAHPSLDFCLDEEGGFLGVGNGGPCESFEIFVEQSAIVASMAMQGNWQQVYNYTALPREEIGRIVEIAHRFPVVEASDKHKACYWGNELALFQLSNGGALWARGHTLKLILAISHASKG